MSKHHLDEKQGECRIHVGRTKGPCRAANKEKKCVHAENVRSVLPWAPNEVHHAVCVSSVNEYRNPKYGMDAKHIEKIDACYRLTDWCIHQSNNLISLPKKATYIKNAASRSENLPCHDLDHNIVGGYADDVTSEIELRIWQKIKQVVESKGPHFKPYAVAQEFAALEEKFMRLLRVRGHRASGTSSAFQNMGTGNWFLPFSMASTAVAMNRHGGGKLRSL
jgi:hypothetical protein